MFNKTVSNEQVREKLSRYRREADAARARKAGRLLQSHTGLKNGVATPKVGRQQPQHSV